MLIGVMTPTRAASTSTEDTTAPFTEGTQRWWPGNPDPIPGSEAWLQLYGHYSTGSPRVADSCASEALWGVLIPGGTAAAIDRWILKSVFSVKSFGIGFGISFAYGYYQCISR